MLCPIHVCRHGGRTARNAICLGGCNRPAALEAVRVKLANPTLRDRKHGLRIITQKKRDAHADPLVPAAVAELLAGEPYTALAARSSTGHCTDAFFVISAAHLNAWHASRQ